MANKSSAMWIVILLAWSCITFVWLPFVLETLLKGPLLSTLSLCPVCMWIQLATLLGIHQAASAVFGTNVAMSKRLVRHDIRDPVAVLYTTMNDFRESAALSCVSLDYPSFHVFLLDDSTSARYRRLVDEFHQRFPDRTTVIRRSSKAGFKGGNLNHALTGIHASFPFFAVADADTILPRHFLIETIKHFHSPRVGFAQARIETKQERRQFVAELATGQNLYWRRIVPATARYGFMMFHGHGAVVRTSVWKEVGGFPQVVAEDLAFSTRAREHGYVGILAYEVVCEEKFPRNFSSLATRQLKYVRGAAEHIRTDCWRFLRSSRVPWFEKLDRLLGNLGLVSAAPFMLSLVFLGIARHTRTNDHLLGQSWRLLAPASAAVFFPLVPAILELWRRPCELLVHICSAVCVQLSMTTSACADALNVGLTGRNFFTATGNIRASRQIVGQISHWRAGLLLLLIMASARSMNLTGIILMISMLAIAAANQWGWRTLGARGLRLLPMLLIVGALLEGELSGCCIVLAGTYSASL
jgi:hypothetical protein